MCAIFGFSGFQDPPLLHTMAEILHHRGPDGDGFLESDGFSMGACRLAIIDPASGNQPLYNETGSLAVCFNGEIYNHEALRKTLKDRGHRFATRCDTEVLVHGFEEWGEDLVPKLNGMFAFAIHNRESGDTFFARDRCGQKPLYYWNENGRFIFASEIKAILEAPQVERRCNHAAIDAFLRLRYVPEPATMFAGIVTLPAAHTLTLSASGKTELKRYWKVSPGATPLNGPPENILDQLEEKFLAAVRLTCHADVPVAAYLSGGVDSSLIAAAAARENANLHTFSIGFHSAIDETPLAAETARLLGTRHHEVYLEPEDFAGLPRVIHQMDRPVGDAIVLAFDKLAETAGADFRAVLSGEGADEIFGGYPFHKILPPLDTYDRAVPAGLDALPALALRATPVGLLNRFFPFPAYLGAEGKHRLQDFWSGHRRRSLRGNYEALRTLCDLECRRSLYTEDFRRLARDDASRNGAPPESGAFLDRLLALQFDDWLPDWALIRQDKNAMAHSLEVRLPFLDHELIEFAFTIPPALKARFSKDKIIERGLAARLLPRRITRRPKIPFYLPAEYFFDNPVVRDLIDDTLNDSRIEERGYFNPPAIRALRERMHARDFLVVKQVMALVILELWHRVFIDRSLDPA